MHVMLVNVSDVILLGTIWMQVIIASSQTVVFMDFYVRAV